MSASLKSGSTPCLAEFSKLGLEEQEELREQKVSVPFGVYPHQAQFLPTSLDDVLDAQVELAAHYSSVWLPGESVEEIKGDGVDLVVDIKTVQHVRTAFEAFK
jgi:hypothetical protein